MRKVLRQTVRDGFERIAVICGAWHVPALRDLPPAAADDRLLRGLPKVKATLTWVPWTYGRLSYTSGYGAGIRSPGWYDHLFRSPGQPIERWLAKAAAVLRDEGIPASSAHVIESVRLAEALAALRGRPLAGLEEVTEAARSVLCEGSDLLTELIQRRLVVGERLGAVPPATPMVPLQRDLQDQQRHLRLRPEAEPRDYDLDLRKPNDLARSRLLYRLALLEVAWGTPRQGRARNIGTFRESWQLTWRPELDPALIEASMWGSTVAAAAAQRARSIALGATALDELTALTERCLLADLGDALPTVLGAVRDRAALEGDDARIDAALGALYDSDESDGRQGAAQRRAGFGASAPRVARWLGDIRAYFPVSVVQVMQKDAIERLGLTRLLLEPEMLDAVEPDVHLVGTLLSLSRVIPEQARESARAVVRAVTAGLERRLAQRTRSAVAGALNRASRTSRPRRPADIDWNRTIRANLRNYLPQHRTIVPERLIGYARKQQAVARDVILCLDQSGSMASSVVYAGVFGAVLASIRSLHTSVVAFDTSVVDLTGQLSDPVDVLFGTQLGGGTDINQAVAYCQQLITRPASTIFILISDLFEGGDRDEMLRRIADMTAAGIQVIALLALSDDGAPGYDHENAAALAGLGVTAFACTPDAFGDLMAAAIERRDIAAWAQSHRPAPA